MASTGIKTGTLRPFLQPSVGSIVDVQAFVAIDWLKTGVHIFVKDAGVFEVISKFANTYSLKLKHTEIAIGELVLPNILYPIYFQPAKVADTFRSQISGHVFIFQDNALIGAEIIGMVFADNVPFDMEGKFNSTTGELDFTDFGGLYDAKILMTISK